jgi:hypothetical protein
LRQVARRLLSEYQNYPDIPFIIIHYSTFEIMSLHMFINMCLVSQYVEFWAMLIKDGAKFTWFSMPRREKHRQMPFALLYSYITAIFMWILMKGVQRELSDLFV